MSDWLEPDLRAIVDGLSDTNLLTLVLYGEARSEPIEGQVAVACVVRNRAFAPGWWGDTYRTVLLKPWQFSCLHPKGGASNYKRVLAFAKLLAANGTLDAKGKQCAAVARCVLNDLFADNTKGASHYHTVSLQPRPAWAQAHVPACQKGTHLFYVGVK